MHKVVNGVKIDLTPEEIAEIQAEWARNEAEAAKVAYLQNRAGAYPPIGDQMDALWKLLGSLAEANPTAASMYHDILAVKAKYPKPDGTV